MRRKKKIQEEVKEDKKETGRRREKGRKMECRRKRG